MDLVARVSQLRADVTRHKAAIGQHRRALHVAKTELTQLEAELAKRGIGLQVVHTNGVGGIHGQRSGS